MTSKDAKRGVFAFDIVEGLYPMIKTSDFLEWKQRTTEKEGTQDMEAT